MAIIAFVPGTRLPYDGGSSDITGKLSDRSQRGHVKDSREAASIIATAESLLVAEMENRFSLLLPYKSALKCLTP